MANEKSSVEPGRYSYACLLRLPEVMERVGLGRSEIYRRIAADPPTFPAPVKLGERAIAFSSLEIDEWVSERIASRDASGRAA